MRKFILTLMASLLSCSAAQAFWPEALDSSLEVGVGYRQDSLKWKTSSRFNDGYSSDYSSYEDYNGIGLPVKFRSELEWKDLQIWQIEARGKYVTCDNIYLRACGDYGWITSGKNRDRDFVTLNSGYNDYYNNGSAELARSRSHVRGHVYDAKLAIGYQFKMCDDSFSVAPLVGYSWHGQHLKDRHLRQRVFMNNEVAADEEFVAVERQRVVEESYSYYDDYYYDESAYFDTYGSSSSSYGNRNHSTYHTRWNGPFIGFDFDYRFWCDWTLFGGYEFHWAEYHAKARWNLRTDLLDGFHHRAKNAYGHVFDIGLKWDFCECWTVGIKGQFQWWWAHRGRDRALIAEGQVGNVRTDCFVSIPLRDIKWHSESVSIDIGMVF